MRTFNSIKISRFFSGLLLVLAIVATIGCGYKFAGQGSLPMNIMSISVDILVNKTAETGVENGLTNDITYEITRNGKATLKDRADAEANLTGVITNAIVDTISRTDVTSSSERRIRFIVDMTLTNKDGVVIWSKKGITHSEEYVVAGDKNTTEANKAVAITVLSQRLGEKVYNALVENF